MTTPLHSYVQVLGGGENQALRVPLQPRRASVFTGPRVHNKHAVVGGYISTTALSPSQEELHVVVGCGDIDAAYTRVCFFCSYVHAQDPREVVHMWREGI